MTTLKLKNTTGCIKSVILVTFTLILLQSCNPIVETIGPFSSPNIEESKKRDVFLWEYYPQTIMIYDTIKFEIKEVFAEKQYQYYSYQDLRYKKSDNKSQIKIVAKQKLNELKYFDLWVVKDFDWSAHPYGIVKNYDQQYPPDTLFVEILKVDIGKNGLAGKDDKKNIGSFILCRK